MANSIMPLLAGRWTWRGAYEILGAATVVAGIIPLFVIGRELGTAPAIDA